MTKSRGIQAPRRRWHAWEEAFLQQVYANHLSEAIAAVLKCPLHNVTTKARRMGLRKDPAFLSETARQRTQAVGHGSHATRFQKGFVPANKGVRRPGFHSGRMRETQFKAGQRPCTWKPVGRYTVNSDGYLDQKVNDDPGPRFVRWKPVHVLVWEAANGPAPKGMCVVFKPGRFSAVLEQITLDAIECISRAELLARNSIHNLPDQLKEVVLLRGQLTRQINKQTRRA